MKRYLILIAICLFLAGCLHRSPTWHPVCRHKSMLVASTVGETYPVRMMVGDLAGKRHVQVQALIDEKWEYVDMPTFPCNAKIKVIPQPSRFAPDMIVTMDRWTHEMLDNIIESDRFN